VQFEEADLPGLEEQEVLELHDLISEQHFTQPPARYNEATLIKALEAHEIGRPSTYAPILSTIQDRNYIEKNDQKRFQITEIGEVVNDLLVEHFPEIVDIDFTAEMEDDLDKIAEGKKEWVPMIKEFYNPFEKNLEKKYEEVTKKEIIPETTDKKCPDCKKPLVIRFGKAGEFLGCSGFPECKFTANFTRDDKGAIMIAKPEQPEQSDITCPKCGKNLVQKIGKYGPFLSCPGYPECKHIHQEKLSMPCPQCGGNVVERRWRGGTFWGCSGYPKCRFSIFGEVAETPCPECKSPYLLVTKDKAGKETHSCPNKECGHKK